MKRKRIQQLFLHKRKIYICFALLLCQWSGKMREKEREREKMSSYFFFLNLRVCLHLNLSITQSVFYDADRIICHFFTLSPILSRFFSIGRRKQRIKEKKNQKKGRAKTLPEKPTKKGYKVYKRPKEKKRKRKLLVID